MDIRYVSITEDVEERILRQWGAWVRDYGCLQRGEGCALVAALDGDTVAGFAAIHPQRWIAPLQDREDAFIEVIEVAQDYRRQGIATEMLRRLETAARAMGFAQIRGWSSDDKDAALQLWIRLGYCMCPAAMLGQSVLPGCENRQIPGYYFAKRL